MSRLEQYKALVIYAQERRHVETTFVINFEVTQIRPRNQSLGLLESMHTCRMLKRHQKERKGPIKIFLHIPYYTFTDKRT